VIYREGQRLSYKYDFGDGWYHTLLVEKILTPQKSLHHPLCLKGMRACPPEDVGGVWGYKNFLEAIHDPDHDEHDEYLTWIGGEFDPDAFDLTEVNNQLRSMGRGRSTEALNPWGIHDEELKEVKIDLNSPWVQTFPKEQQFVAEELPLRRDVVYLLTYLRDNRVTGTQSTGNLPLKAISEICAKFVNPPQLVIVIGKYVHHLRSEFEVWPLYFRHVLVSVGGLVTGGPGRRWKLTPLGERFLAAPPTLQVWLLLATWWIQTNWAIASPFDLRDGPSSLEFTRSALKHLLDIPAGEQASFAQFADLMIEDSRMVWPTENQDNAQSFLRSIIRGTVIDPLVEFGILQTEYETQTRHGEEFHELSSFRITPFGKGLLEAIHSAMKPDQL